jgi:glycosyltransferase involved in cell wall biosynthesis
MIDKQIRILHVVGTLNPGGVETWLLNVWKHIDRERFQFDFCVTGSEPGLYAGKVEELGGEIPFCPRDGNLWGFRRRFRQLLRERRYHVVHSHVTLFSGAILRWADQAGVPVRIAHSHTSQDNKPTTASRMIYRKLMKAWIRHYATDALAASQPAAEYLFGKYWQEDQRVRVLYYGINPQAFRQPVNRHEVRNELGIPIDAPVVGHVGNFVQAKNHAFLVQVAFKVLRRRPDVHFLLIGDGHLRAAIEAQASALGISSQLHFVGTRVDVPRVMLGAMDSFLFPSLYEGFGLSLLEAQATGLKCLASTALPDEVALSSGSVEFLSVSAGADVWAANLLRLLDLPREDKNIISIRVAQSPFSIQRCVVKLANVYTTLRPSIAPILAGQNA